MKKYFNIWTVLLITALVMGIYHTVIYPWMNRWGVTDAEVNMVLPGDGTEKDWIVTSTRGITIQAPASEVWKWVVQLGQDQAGFYSNDWLENLFLSDIHNADVIHPEWLSHKIGDPIPGAGGAVYQRNFTWPTKAYEEGRMLYLWGPIAVLPVDNQASRLILRTYAPSDPLISEFTYGWMHFVMERGLLLGIKARAEGSLNSDIILQIISKTGWLVSMLGMAVLLFRRRSGWGWGLIALGYAAAILIITSDFWSAAAGFLWWGVITAGFLKYGRNWWKDLLLAMVCVILTFIFSPQPFLTFGTLFLVITLVIIGFGVARNKSNLNRQIVERTAKRETA
jgi:hypothetical protein